MYTVQSIDKSSDGLVKVFIIFIVEFLLYVVLTSVPTLRTKSRT